MSDMDSRESNKTTREDSYKFSSTCSTYLTLIGYGLGMGDVWRFPFLVFRNGGGAFIIMYVIMVIVCGIPMYFLEYSIGKFSCRGPYKIWDICPLFRGVGISISLVFFVYMVGSSILRCWLMLFLIHAFQDPIPWSHCKNDWNTPFCKDNLALVSRINDSAVYDLQNASECHYSNTSRSLADEEKTKMNISQYDLIPETSMSAAEEFWQYKILQLSSGIWDLSPVIWQYVLLMLLLRLSVCLGTIKSIKSIEKVIYVTTPVPLLMSIAVFIRSLMLPGAGNGITFFFYPKFDTLLNARVWIEAALMAFYSIAFGWGVIVLMASHADFKENCLRTAILLPAIDSVVAIVSGMVCFSVLGNMAYAYNVSITEIINAEMSTGIVAYITSMLSLPTPQLWSGLFLFSVLLSEMDSQLIPFEMIVQSIRDMFPRVKAVSRTIVIFVVTFVMYIVSLPTCTGAGGYMFLWIDWYCGAWVGPIVSLLEVIAVAWIYGLDRFSEDVNMMIGKPIPAVLRISLAVVSPVLITVLFCTSLVEYVPPRYGSYSYPTFARILGWVVVAVIMLPILGQALYTVQQARGPLTTKLKYLMKPTDSWGPNGEEKKSEYQEQTRKYSNRTFTDLVFYNMFGRYQHTSYMNRTKNQSIQELDCLNK